MGKNLKKTKKGTESKEIGSRKIESIINNPQLKLGFCYDNVDAIRLVNLGFYLNEI